MPGRDALAVATVAVLAALGLSGCDPTTSANVTNGCALALEVALIAPGESGADAERRAETVEPGETAFVQTVDFSGDVMYRVAGSSDEWMRVVARELPTAIENSMPPYVIQGSACPEPTEPPS